MLARRTFLSALVAVPLTKPAFGQATSGVARLTLNVRDFGASGAGANKDTAAIQRALDRCGVLGGGEVVFPAGTYLSGAIALRSNTTLRFENGAVISGSADFADYPVTQVRWEGKWIPGHIGLVYAIDANQIGITGPGKIIGNPALGGRPTAQSPLRHPAVIEFIRCRDIRLDGFSAEYRLMWCIHPTNCENISIRNLNIRTTGGNGDGIDIDSCKHVRIDGCDIATGDDCIAIKSGRGSEAYALMQTCEDIEITNSTLADSIFACIGIGSETSGGIRNVRIDNCTVTHAQTFAIYIKSRVGRGAFIEDISVSNLDVSGTVGGFLRCNVLSSGLQDEAPVTGDEGIPALRNFKFSDTPGGLASISRDGQRFALVVPPSPSLREITVFDRQGKTVRKVGEPGLYDLPALSPDGTKLAVVRSDQVTNNVDIWSFDMNTGKSPAVTNDEAQDITPIWSPDGKQVLYVSIPPRNATYWSIYRKAADGSGSAEQLFRFTPGASLQLTDVSADGTYLGFSSGGALFVVPLTGPDPLARKAIEYLRDEYNEFLGRFSPDSRFMAYLSDESERNQVWVRPFDSASGTPAPEGKWRVSKDGGDSMIAWRADGKEMYYLHNDVDTGDTMVMAADIAMAPSFQAGTPKLLFRLPKSPQGNPGQWKNVTQDGQRFVFTVPVTQAVR